MTLEVGDQQGARRRPWWRHWLRRFVDSPSAGRRTAAGLHAPFELIAGAGHLSMLVRPAAVAQAIDRPTTKR